MKKAQFIQSIQREFEGHPLRERFLEELEDHMVDMEEDENEALESQVIEEKMGIPHQIKRQFIAIVDPWRNAFFVAEALMVGFALLIVHIAFHTSLLAFFYERGSVLVTFILFPALFLFAFQMLYIRFAEIRGLTNLKGWLWMTIVTAPGTLAFLAALLLGPLGHSLQVTQLISLFLLYLFLNVIFIALAGFIAEKRPRVNFVARLPLWLYYSAIGVVVGRTWLTYASLEWLADQRLLMLIFSPLFLFDQLFDVAWKNVDSGPFFALHMSMAIVTFVLIYAVIFSFRVKRWNTDRGLILLYFSSFFFVNPQAFVSPPKFFTPSIHVSAVLEKSQLSVFYPYFKYSALNKGWDFISNLELEPESNTLFHYQLEAHKEGFLLKNDLDQIFYLTPNHPELNLKDPEHKYLFQKIASTDDLEFSNTIQTSFEEVPSGYELKDSALSTDQKWWLVVISHESLGNDEVYLIENEVP